MTIWKNQKTSIWIPKLAFGAVLLAVCVCRLFFYRSHVGYMLSPDSYDYMAFDSYAFFALHPVNGRCPVYGIFLDMIEFLCAGGDYLIAVVTAQKILSLLSLLAFAKTLILLGIRQKFVNVITFFYGVSPAVMGWDNSILTESLSLTGTVFFFYLIVRYIKFSRVSDGVGATVVAFLLSFLRAQFLVYLVLLLVFFCWKWFYTEKDGRRNILKQLLILMGAFVLILLYCAIFRRQFGIFSLTDASPRQNLYICMVRGYYTSFENKEMVEMIDDEMVKEENAWAAMCNVLGKYGNAEVSKETKLAFRENAGEYLLDTFEVMLDYAGVTMAGYGYAEREEPINALWSRGDQFHSFLFDNVRVIHVLLASLMEGGAMIYVWIKSKYPPWIHMALFSIAMCTTYLAFFVTCGEYARTMISIMPYFYIMIAMFIQWCTFPINKDKWLPLSERGEG